MGYRAHDGDIASGNATLSASGEQVQFAERNVGTGAAPSAKTEVRDGMANYVAKEGQN